MKEKIKLIETHITDLDEAIKKNDSKKAEALQREIIAVYSSEIDLIWSGLNSNSVEHFDSNAPYDYIVDAQILKAKLENYKVNLATGLYTLFQNTDGSVIVTQHMNQDISTTLSVTFEQTINSIQELSESVLSDADKEILSGKIASISAEKDKQKRWEKIGDTLKWVVDKGIEVGKVALPYIVQSLGAGS